MLVLISHSLAIITIASFKFITAAVANVIKIIAIRTTIIINVIAIVMVIRFYFKSMSVSIKIVRGLIIQKH